jgi:hypothetical protein
MLRAGLPTDWLKHAPIDVTVHDQRTGKRSDTIRSRREKRTMVLTTIAPSATARAGTLSPTVTPAMTGKTARPVTPRRR